MDQRLATWVSSVAGDAEVVFDRPRDDDVAKPTVSVYLLALDNSLPTQRSQRRPLEIALHYLLTTAAPDFAEAHRLLASLVFAALERPDLQVDLRPLAPEIWAAFRTAPRPALLLRQPLVLERPSRVPRVRTPAEINLDLAQPLSGVVLTPSGAPVPYARVEVPALNLSAYADAEGRLDLGLVPKDAREAPLRVVAKGADETVIPERRSDGALVIRFDPKET
jgi:hypothetical protein